MKAFYPAGIWGIFIVTLSLTPGNLINKLHWSEFFTYDKLGHAAFYAVFTVLMIRGYARLKGDPKGFDLLKSCLIPVIVGALMEIIQAREIIGRHFDVFDLIANIIGCLAGLCIYFLLKKLDYGNRS